MSPTDDATVRDRAAYRWESYDLNPVGLSEAHRCSQGEWGPSFGASTLLMCPSTAQAYYQERLNSLTPSLESENNTAFCPVVIHWCSSLFEGETELRDSQFSCVWHMCTWVGKEHAPRPVKELDILLYHSSLYSLETGSLLELGRWPASTNDPPMPSLIALWLQSWVDMPSFTWVPGFLLRTSSLQSMVFHPLAYLSSATLLKSFQTMGFSMVRVLNEFWKASFHIHILNQVLLGNVGRHVYGCMYVTSR